MWVALLADRSVTPLRFRVFNEILAGGCVRRSSLPSLDCFFFHFSTRTFCVSTGSTPSFFFFLTECYLFFPRMLLGSDGFVRVFIRGLYWVFTEFSLFFFAIFMFIVVAFEVSFIFFSILWALLDLIYFNRDLLPKSQ